jgi:hypothetical protein
MATPDFVKFSRAQGDVFEALRLVGDALRKWKVELNRFGRLALSGDEYDGGLELTGDMVPCATLEEGMRLTRGLGQFAFSYLAKPARGYWNLYIFDVAPDSFSVTMDFETSFLSYESEALAMGEWFKAVLLTTVKALKVDVCGFGSDDAYRIRHELLDTEKLLARLREGDLLEIQRPVFHAISLSLIGVPEMQALLASRPVNQFLKYTVSGAYHVLAAVP